MNIKILYRAIESKNYHISWNTGELWRLVQKFSEQNRLQAGKELSIHQRYARSGDPSLAKKRKAEYYYKMVKIEQNNACSLDN